MLIYLDNAATSLPKPKPVRWAVDQAIYSFGSPGRGAYEPALAAARAVHRARELLAQLLNVQDCSRIAFTLNVTMALNMALQGLLRPGDHVISSVCEHNSVLRPLYRLQQQGVEVSYLGCNDLGRIDYDELEQSLRPQTKAVVLAHASNVTGNVIDLARVSAFTREHGLLLILDAAQTLGCYPIDLQATPVDILCFTGHKALLGPQGTGGLYVRPGLELTPLVVGGSGVQSFLPTQPLEMPTALEAGTLNSQGLAGLAAAVEYVLEQGVENIHKQEIKLSRLFLTRIAKIPELELYGDYRKRSERTGIVTLNLKWEEAGALSDWLYEHYEICTRAGAHCAPLLHRALGTEQRGALRFSFGAFNTRYDAEIAAIALQEVAMLCCEQKGDFWY